MRRKKVLYGTPVCKRCYYRFANRRQLAYIVDTTLWWPVSFALAQGLSEVTAILCLDPMLGAIVFFGFNWVAFPLLFSCKDCFRGHSPGKWICGVRAVDRDGLEPIGIASSLKRNLPLLIPVLPFVIAFLLQKGHRLGEQQGVLEAVFEPPGLYRSVRLSTLPVQPYGQRLRRLPGVRRAGSRCTGRPLTSPAARCDNASREVPYE